MRRLTVGIRKKGGTFVTSSYCVVFVLAVSFAIFSDASAHSISIISGTYGQNCGALRGNASRDLINKCDGRETCNYTPDENTIADAGNHCSKDFLAEWRCEGGDSHLAMLSPDAGIKDTLVITCIQPTGAGR